MQDGSLVMLDIYNLAAMKITGEVPMFAVDINGYNNPPNRWGYDVFVFMFLDGELMPVGNKKSPWSDLSIYCNKSSTHRDNGVGCAQKALDNNDYFKELVKDFK